MTQGCECIHPPDSSGLRVVLTGGPGAGKTAVLEVLRRHLCAHVAVLPESASIVFGGGFPRVASDAGRAPAQLAIYHVQDQLEDLAVAEAKAAVLLCDRGTVDGLAYWPYSPDSFWKATGTTHEAAFKRYAAVIHLRTPRAAQGYNHRNPLRTESPDEAAAIDERIALAWAGHPRRTFIESTDNFLDKLVQTVVAVARELPEGCRRHLGLDLLQPHDLLRNQTVTTPANPEGP